MSFSNDFLGHFLIVDIGHPMTVNSTSLIKKSLQNVLSLACNIRDISRMPVFGCGLLSPSFEIIQQWNILTGNFLAINSNLEKLVNPSNIGTKVTIADYRSFLDHCIEIVVTDFELYANKWKSKTEIRDKFNPLHYWPNQIQVTLITKKGGSLISKILNKFQTYSDKLKKIEIVEISNFGDTKILKNTGNFISYITITENNYYLDDIFKKWLTCCETNCEQLQIVLHKEPELHINCELHDCLINPGITTLPNTLSLSTMSSVLITQKPIYKTVNNQSIHKMEVVTKIGINDLYPSVFFGFPRWIYSKRTCITKQDEFRYNDEIFKTLCVQLHTAEIGLLARFNSSSQQNKIYPLCFIISDGMKLLMMNIVPTELQLPQFPERVTAPRAVDDIKEEATHVVRSVLEKMEMEEISPKLLSIGAYGYFTEHFKSDFKKRSGKNVNSGFERISKAKSTSAPSPLHGSISPGEYIPKFLTESQGKQVTPCSAKSPQRFKQSSRKRHEDEPIHPALMSPGTMAKYRRYNSHHYELLEAIEPGVAES